MLWYDGYIFVVDVVVDVVFLLYDPKSSLVHICQSPDRCIKSPLHSAQKCQPAIQQIQIPTSATSPLQIVTKIVN